ncbi:hypothetical protein V2J09_019165 [Rumex salicifolius]
MWISDLTVFPLLCAMDADTVVISADAERVEENGLHSDEAYEGDETIANEMISDANATSEVLYVTKDGEMNEPLPGEVNMEDCKLTNGSSAPGEVGLQETHHEKISKKQMSQGKSKTTNPLSSKIAGPAGLKKTSNGKEEKVTSNGITSTSSRSKQSYLISTRSVNDGKIATGNANKIKPTLTTNIAKKTKQPSKSQPAPSMDNVVESNGPMDKTELKPLSNEEPHKVEGDQDSAGSPTSGDAKTTRVSKLPTYGFSFKCNERAEKRREFYSKLEEKIHAKEAEIINQEAKSKETQEAELRMLRKSLNFKATPMPNFYQEPTPAKVELKKIPTTRPKSPKLGRRKSSPPAVANTDLSDNHLRAKPDLAMKVSQNKSAKTTSLALPQKPQRKSLPRLPSQKTPLTKTTVKASPCTVDSSNSGSAPTQIGPEAGPPELGQTERVTEMEQVVHLEGSQDMPTTEQEAVVESRRPKFTSSIDQTI